MIEKLTEEQQKKFPEYVKKWIDIGLDTKPSNKALAEKFCREAYRVGGLEEPKLILWAQSPIGMLLTAKLVKELAKKGYEPYASTGCDKKVRAQVHDQARNQAWSQVGDQVRAQVRAQVHHQVDAQVYYQVGSQVEDQVRNQVEDQVYDQVGAQVGAQVHDQARNQAWSQVGDQVRDQVRAQVYNQVRDQVRAQVYNQVVDQVGDQVYNQVVDQIVDQVRNQVWDQVGDEAWDQVYDQVGDEAWAKVHDQVVDQVGDQVYDQVDAQVGDQVCDQVDAQVRDQVRDQVGDQVRDQIVDQVGAQVRGEVGDQVWDASLSEEWNETYSWGQHDANYFSFYDYFREVCGLVKETEALQPMINLSKETGWHLFYKNIAVLCEKPLEVCRNERGQLHNFNGPAIKWADGYELHAFNGVRLTGKEQYSSKSEYTKEEILSETNADIRRELIRKIGILKSLEIMDAKILDTHESKVGGKYELVSIDIGDNRIRPFLKMKNPSMDNVWHVEGVRPEIKTVKEALCYRNRLTEFSEPKELS